MRIQENITKVMFKNAIFSLHSSLLVHLSDVKLESVQGYINSFIDTITVHK